MANVSVKGSFVHIPICPTLTTKVVISKGTRGDTYTITADDCERNVFPLQYGPGAYNVKIYQNTGGKKYALLQNNTVNADKVDDCWRQPSQYVWYGEEVRQLSDEINAKEPTNKVSAYYNYCYKKIAYDHIRALFVKKNKNYLPNLAEVIQKKKGICFDKASLLCALCRANGYECKLMIGYVAKKSYHAWCQVLVNGKWHTLDPTYGKKYNIEDYEPQRWC